MGIKARIEALEKKQSPDTLKVIIMRFTENKPLPAPAIIGGVEVSYCLADHLGN